MPIILLCKHRGNGRLKERQIRFQAIKLRLKVLQHTHEAEGMRQQIRERDESLARRAERLRQLQALYERALQDKQRVEEAAWSERQALHDERRALELRVREEAGRARQAEDALARVRGTDEPGKGLFSRILGVGGGGAATAASPPGGA